LGYFDGSELFLTEREAKLFAEKCIAGGCKDVKCYQVTDIWNYTARNFSEKISTIIESRTNEDGNCVGFYEVEGMEQSLEDEINIAAIEAGLKVFSCEVWNVFGNPGVDIYALSCAWIYNEKLYHYTDTLEVF
jgi:hypothetical protein